MLKFVSQSQNETNWVNTGAVADIDKIFKGKHFDECWGVFQIHEFAVRLEYTCLQMRRQMVHIFRRNLNAAKEFALHGRALRIRKIRLFRSRDIDIYPVS